MTEQQWRPSFQAPTWGEIVAAIVFILVAVIFGGGMGKRKGGSTHGDA